MSEMDAGSVLRAVEDIIRGVENPHAVENEIRSYLAASLGPAWLECALLANWLVEDRVVYTASTIDRLPDGRLFTRVFVVDRDESGRFYVAPPSPVSGYE